MGLKGGSTNKSFRGRNVDECYMYLPNFVMSCLQLLHIEEQ